VVVKNEELRKHVLPAVHCIQNIHLFNNHCSLNFDAAKLRQKNRSAKHYSDYFSFFFISF